MRHGGWRCVVEQDKARWAGRFAQIIKLFDESANMMVMLKSMRNMGIASIRLLDEIQGCELQKISNNIKMIAIAYICHVLCTSSGEI